jgi:hypothetical protein
VYVTSCRGGTSAGQPEGEGDTTGRRGGKPNRRIMIMTSAIVFCAVVVTVAFAWGRDSSDAKPAGIVADSVMTPAAQPVAAAATAAATATEIPTPAPSPQITDAASVAPTVEPATPSATASPTVDGAWSATPSVSTPAPGTDLAASAAALASSLEAQYGVRIVTAGQDWGTDEATQLRNIGALGAALAGVPSSARSAVANNAGGALTYLSNDGGRTEAGWQPYGDRQANYYSNEDVVAGNHVAANQIVLQPGSTAQTIAHEMMHAYQLRDQAPGDFAVALLTAEMKSFMQATGWQQTASDDQVRADAGKSWETLDADFTYSGRPLTYAGENGDMLSLFAPNPLEAFAEAGGLYYAHSTATTLPDWPEYWAWFAANVG